MEHLLLLPRIAKWENILGLLRVGQVLMVGCNPYRAKQKLQDQNTIDCSVPKVCTYPQRCTPQNKTAAFPCAAYKIRDIIIQFPLRLSVKRTMVGTLKHPSFPGGCFCFEVINVQDILLSDKEYAPWLVDSLSELNIQNVRAIALVGISENGECITGYYNCNLADKAVIAANIQADALYGTVMANADQIMHKAEELEEEYGDDLRRDD